jgi:hypothetical protein
MTRIDEVRIEWTEDQDGLGCQAVAEVSYPIEGAKGDRRLEWLRSGGLYRIDPGSDQAYLNQIVSEQLEDLREHLEHFGVRPHRHEWAFLITQSPSASAKRHGVGPESTQAARSRPAVQS